MFKIQVRLLCAVVDDFEHGRMRLQIVQCELEVGVQSKYLEAIITEDRRWWGTRDCAAGLISVCAGVSTNSKAVSNAVTHTPTLVLAQLTIKSVLQIHFYKVEMVEQLRLIVTCWNQLSNHTIEQISRVIDEKANNVVDSIPLLSFSLCQRRQKFEKKSTS
jgi:hypothetical protein